MGTDSAEAIDTRLETAEQELAVQGDFKYRIVNDDLGRAAGELEQIVRAEAGIPLDSAAE
jgi:guanylate kinase